MESENKEIKIQVHLVEGAYRTVNIHHQVEFYRIQDAILKNLAKHSDDSNNQKDEIEWIFALRYVEPSSVIYHRGRKIWIHPHMTYGQFINETKPIKNRAGQDIGRFELRVRYFPSDLEYLSRQYWICFLLLYKQVYQKYLKTTNVPLAMGS